MSARAKIELLQQPAPTNSHFIRVLLVHFVRNYRLKILTEKGTHA
jgi:hypothetical protein